MAFKVKFNWSLRSQTREKDKNDCEKTCGTSRTAKFFSNMKVTKPTRFKEHSEKDAARKRKAYISIEDKAMKQKAEQRRKWAASKQEQRKKKSKKVCQRNEGEKPFKDLTQEERKEYFKLKMKESRARMSKQKKTTVKQKDKERKKTPRSTACLENEQPDQETTNLESQIIPQTPTCPEDEVNSRPTDKHDEEATNSGRQSNTGRKVKRPRRKGNSSATFYRKRQKIMKAMPQSPRTYAQLVESLTFGPSATPRKKQQLINQGINISPEADIIASNIKKHIKRLSKSYNSKDRRALSAVLQASTRDPEPPIINECMNSKRSQPKHFARSYKYFDRTCRRARRFLGVNRRSWQKVRKHKAKDIIIEIKKTRQGISDEDALTICNYWWSSEVSRPVPLKKRVKHGIPTHHLECSYSTAYQRFKAKYPEIKVGYVKFIHFRPKNVRHMKAAERAVCCCIKCENIKMKLNAINKRASSKSVPKLSSDEASLAQMTMCKSENSQISPKPCIDRECPNCGVKNITKQLGPLLETDIESKVQYKKWKRVEREIHAKNKVSTIKVIDLVDLEGTLGDIVNELEQEMTTFNGHLFRFLFLSRWGFLLRAPGGWASHRLNPSRVAVELSRELFTTAERLKLLRN